MAEDPWGVADEPETQSYPDPQQGGSWDATEQPEQQHDDVTSQPDQAQAPEDPWGVKGADKRAAPEDPWGVKQDEEPSTLGTALRGVARSALPTTAGIIGGLGGAALGSLAMPGVGTIGGALVGGAAAGGVTRKLQDEITDTLGLDSPESRERDVQAHPYVSTAAELAPAVATLSPGNLSTSLATRLASGAALGGFDVINQGISKGFGNIDPTQTAIAAGAGAALPIARPWAEGAAGAALRSVGASRAAATLGERAGTAAAEDTGVVKVDNGVAPDIAEATGPGRAPSPGIDVNESPSSAGNLDRDFPAYQPEAMGTPYRPNIRDIDTGVGANDNFSPNAAAERQPGLGEGEFGYEPPMPQDVQSEARLPPYQPEPSGRSMGEFQPPVGEQERTNYLPSEIQETPPLSPEEIDARRAQLAATPAPPMRSARGNILAPQTKNIAEAPTRRFAPLEDQPFAEDAEPLQGGYEEITPRAAARTEEPVAQAAAQTPAGFIPEDLSIPAAMRRAAPEIPGENIESGKFPAGEAAGQNENAPRPQSLGAAAPEQGALGTYGSKAEQLQHQSVYRGLKGELGAAISKITRPLQETFAPENISASGKAMDAVIKRVQGNMSARTQADVQRVSDTLDKIGSHIQKTPAGAREEVIQNYERGVVSPENPLNRWAEEQRKVAQRADTELQKHNGGQADYGIRQNSMFDQAEDLGNFVQQFRQDNERNPTLGEIRKEGYKLRDDFLDADGSPNVQRIVDHQNFLRNQVIQAKEILEQARNTDVGGKMILSEGEHVGLEPIERKLTGDVQFYAPREVKLVFERFLNPYSRDPAVRNVLDGMMRAKTVTNSINLAVDLYHAAFMATEGVGKGIGMGLSKMATDPAAGLKDIMQAPLSPYTLAKVGKRSVFDAVRNPEKVTDPHQQNILQAMKDGDWIARSRGTDITPELETGFLKNYTTMWKPMFEEYKHDLVQRGLKSVNAFNKGQYLASAGHATLAPLQAVTDGLQLIMHPFFNQYIPMLKAGAVYRDVGNYISAHPVESYLDANGKIDAKAAREDWAGVARRAVKSSDNAMGELNQSTLYWPPMLKYLGNMATVSLGWNVGNWRQVGSAIGSMINNPKSFGVGSKDYNPAITTLVGGLTTMALANVLYQTLKTGKPPSSITDVIAPMTGGKASRSNMPERAILPGYEKDYLEAAHIIGGPEGTAKGAKDLAYNKLASIWRSMIDFTNNTDWSGHTIVDPREPLASRMADWSKYFAQHLFEPIGVQNLTRGAANPQTNISAPERTVGVRHAPAQWEKPQQYQAGVQKKQKKEVEESQRFHKRIGFDEGGEVTGGLPPVSQAGDLLSVSPTTPGQWSDEDEARRQATDAHLVDTVTSRGLNFSMPKITHGIANAVKGFIGNAQAAPMEQGYDEGGLVDQPTFAEQGTDYDNPAAQAAATTTDARGHMTDEFKLPNHMTFSTGSKYHGKNGQEGGKWDPLPYSSGDPNDKPYMFTPGKTNLETSTPRQLGDYFSQQEPNSLLKLPNIASPDAQNTGSAASNNDTYARGGPVKSFRRS